MFNNSNGKLNKSPTTDIDNHGYSPKSVEHEGYESNNDDACLITKEDPNQLMCDKYDDEKR